MTMTKREIAMNNERLDWMEKAVNAEVALRELLQYLGTSKFQGVDNDFIYVSTDLYPKLVNVYNALAEDVPHWTSHEGISQHVN